MKETLILFSGGKDSFLSALIAIEKGYRVNLITFDNGCELNVGNVLVGAKRIKKKFGSKKVNIIGIKKTDVIWRELIKDFNNLGIEYILNNFGNITISQFNCLSCRLAMYVLSIIVCKQKNIDVVFDGARKSQLFAIEQEPLISEFKQLFNQYGIEINFPLLDEKDDFYIKNQLLAKGFVPKMNETQCLVGLPISEMLISEDIVSGIKNVYVKQLYPKIENIINKYKNFEFAGNYI